MSDDAYPRDLIGYGRNPPHARWPGGARIAVQLVLNYEQGGEMSVLHGDDHFFLHQALAAGKVERVDAQGLPGLVVQRNTQVILVQDRPQRLRDLLEETAEVELADQGVVDVEQEPQPVALLGEVALGGLGALIVEDVVHGHGHEARDLGEQLQVARVIGPRPGVVTVAITLVLALVYRRVSKWADFTGKL